MQPPSSLFAHQAFRGTDDSVVGPNPLTQAAEPMHQRIVPCDQHAARRYHLFNVPDDATKSVRLSYGHLEKCLCEIKVALLLYSGLMIFGLRSSLSV